MKLDPQDWATVLRHLDTALDLPATEQSLWLEALALEPPALKDALRKLLEDRSAIETADFLGAGAQASTLQAGTRLGPWRLLSELGQGGMASVWLAEKADGSHQRQVALKLPHRIIGSTVVVERFLRERAILSTLQHPHIAQVLDAGSAAGQPWLALEYVPGQPITAHAVQQGMDTRARLRLFLPVLQAVQHAHGQLVIHRDLKPANVLVAADGTVKLLDFGVAKLLGAQSLDELTATTREGGSAFTPQYASPEQVGGRPLGVASDVYSLGVLLYELLTGQLPYVVKHGSAAALEQAILGAELRRPSVAVTHRALARRLRGDLDTIALKALHPEPAQRYASAAALADDIERHLQARPILARPRSFRYGLHKLWQRQRLALSAAGLLLLALTAGAAGTLWQAQRAQEQAERAQAVQRFLVTLLQSADPQRGQARELTVGELLDLNAGRIEREFAGQPAVQTELLQTLATLYLERGDAAKSQPLMERAVALHAAAGRVGREGHVQALLKLSEVQDEQGDYAAERATLAQAAALAERHFGADHAWVAEMLAAQAWIAMNEGRLDEARRLGEQAQSRFGEPTVRSLRTSGSLATIYIALGDLERARDLLTQSRAASERLGGQGSVDRLMDGYNLARVRFNLGEFDMAETELAALMPEFDRITGPSHDRTLLARGLLAQVLAARGRMAEGLAQAQANLAAALAANSPDSDTVQAQRAITANLLRLAGRPLEALPLAQAALDITTRRYPQPTPQRESIRRVLGEVQLAAGQREAGIATLEAALAGVRQLKSSGADLQGPAIQLLLAVALREGPRAAEAAPLAVQACAARGLQMGENLMPVLRCRTLEAWLQARQGEASLASFAATRDRLLRAGLHEQHPLRAELLALEAELLALDPARGAESKALLRQADAQYRKLLGQPLPQPLLTLH